MRMTKWSKEEIKTCSLICLFLSALILTAYKMDIFEDFLFPKGSPYPYSLGLEEGLRQTLKPTKIIIRFGGERSTQILSGQQRFYEEMQIPIRRILSHAKNITEVPEKEIENAKSFKSIQLEYPLVSGSLLSRSFFLENSLINGLSDVSEILVPLVGKNSFYIVTESKNFKIQTETIPSLDFVDNLENSNYLNYQSLHSLFGVNSKVLVPTGDFDLHFENYETISGVDSEKITRLAQDIFGEKYDFAARITETDGSEIYTYNYGQQVLKIRPNGYIHYTNEDVELRELNLEESTHHAMSFLESIHYDLNQLALIEAKQIEVKGRKSYLFRYAKTLKDLRILSHSEEIPVNIIVSGASVYSYTSTLRDNIPYDFSLSTKIMSPLEVLSPSFNSVLKSKFQIQDFNQLFDKIHGIELVYYMDGDYRLSPCWKMNIDGKDYLFNAYTGEIEPYGLV